MSTTTVVCTVIVASLVRPWRVQPRPARSGRGPWVAPGAESTLSRPPWGLPAAPAGALWGGAVVASAVASPLLGLAVFAWPFIRRGRRRRAEIAGSHRVIVRALPEVVDLIVIGVGAGLTPRAALARCEPWLPPPFAGVFGEARRRAAAGESFAQALESTAAPLGESGRPLVGAVLAAEHTVGSNLATLVRVGDEARRRRRVEAQERARRLPVTMLLPLVCCVLPAFGLLAVAPLLIGSLRDLGLGVGL